MPCDEEKCFSQFSKVEWFIIIDDVYLRETSLGLSRFILNPGNESDSRWNASVLYGSSHTLDKRQKTLKGTQMLRRWLKVTRIVKQQLRNDSIEVYCRLVFTLLLNWVAKPNIYARIVNRQRRRCLRDKRVESLISVFMSAFYKLSDRPQNELVNSKSSIFWQPWAINTWMTMRSEHVDEWWCSELFVI